MIKLVDRIVHSRRHDSGIDYESDRYVLLRAANGDEVWWWTSGKSWAGRLEGYTHRPGELVFAPRDGRRNAQTTTLHEGGRLSLKLLGRSDIFLKIQEAAGTYIAWDQLRAIVGRPPKTLIVTEDKTP